MYRTTSSFATPLKVSLITFRAVNWDEPDRRLEWYHNTSSILQAGPCVRSNQLDFDEEVMFKSTRYLYSAARRPPSARPFCLTVSLTHPHDPYTIQRKYWDRYEGVNIHGPSVVIPQEEQDPHSQRLLRVCELAEKEPPGEAVIRARRAYYGAVSYVDDNVGRLLEVLEECGMAEDTVVVFSADHGDMLGERGLWCVARGASFVVTFPPAFFCFGTDPIFPGTKCPGLKALHVSLSLSVTPNALLLRLLRKTYHL